MAYTTVDKHSLHFNTVSYTGDGSSPRTISGVGFQPDLTFIKPRNLAYSWTTVDVLRGATGNGTGSGSLLLNSNGGAEGDSNGNGALTAFTSDGFTLTSGSSDSDRVNGSYNYCSWNWKAGGAGSANTDGSINSSVSANTTAGFSIVKFTGTGANATVGHGLGAVPAVIFVKHTTAAENWCVYHKSIGNTHAIFPNTTSGDSSNVKFWNNTSPTSSVFSVGNGHEVNGSGDEMIAYCFVEKRGFFQAGKYFGNGSTDGTFVPLTLKPKFVLQKRSDSTTNWYLMTDKLSDSGGLGNPLDRPLFSNLNSVENDGDNRVDFLSNGFKYRDSGAAQNGSGNTNIYMAWGQSLVGSNNVPCTAR